MTTKNGKKSILLIEDEPIISLATSLKLKSFGYSVHAVDSGEKALRFIGNDPQPDLILMDINLGTGIDGTETARKILEDYTVPIVFLTSHSEKEYVDRVREITRYGYVIKNSGDFVLQSSIEMAFELFEAHEKLRKSEELYRSLFENMESGFAFCGIEYENGEAVDCRYLAVNDAFVRQTGLKDVVGKRASDIIPEIDMSEPGLRDIFCKAFMSGGTQTCELYVNALAKWYSITAYVLHNDYLITMFNDITERKKIEEKIRRSETEFRTIFEFASVGIVQVVPEDGRIVRCNNTYCGITGYSMEELKGMSFSELTHPEDREKDWDMFTKALRKEYSEYHIEKRYVRKDGGIRWVKVNAVFLLDESGKVQWSVGIVEDIQERKQLESSLKETKEKYNSLLRTLPAGIAVTGNDCDSEEPDLRAQGY